MVETFSVERRKLMRFFGAKVILTPAAERGSGMVRKAKELADKNGWFLASQFANPANPAYHSNTTGPEILDAFRGEKLDYWVTGWGTGGTLTGTSKILKVARPGMTVDYVETNNCLELKVVVTEPENASLLKNEPWSPHAIQGWTPDFVPGKYCAHYSSNFLQRFLTEMLMICL